LFIAILQPLGLAFFNSIIKFLTNLVFKSFSTSFYLLFFFYMLYNSKWFENFKHVANLPRRLNPKKHHHFWTFFHTNVTLWSLGAMFFVGPKKDFCKFKHLYLVVYIVKISEIFSTSSQTRVLQDPTIRCVQQCFFSSKIWLLY